MLKLVKSIRRRTLSRSSSRESVSGGGPCGAGYRDVREKELSKLHRAAWAGNAAKVRGLAKRDPSPLDKERRTPLHLACAKGHSAIVQELLSWNAKTSIGDKEAKTPLMKAVECGHRKCVSILLNHEVEMEVRDCYGNTCLHLATQHHHADIAEELLRAGSNPNLKNMEFFTPLHIAVFEHQLPIADLVLQNGADYNCIDNLQRTPLMHACERGDETMVALLLQYGADMQVKDVKGWTASDYALLKGNENCCSFLERQQQLRASGTSHLSGSQPSTAADSPSGAVFYQPLGLPATEATGDDSGEDTGTGSLPGSKGGYDSWGDDTDVSLTIDDKRPKGEMRVSLAKYVAFSETELDEDEVSSGNQGTPLQPVVGGHRNSPDCKMRKQRSLKFPQANSKNNSAESNVSTKQTTHKVSFKEKNLSMDIEESSVKEEQYVPSFLSNDESPNRLTSDTSEKKIGREDNAFLHKLGIYDFQYLDDSNAAEDNKESEPNKDESDWDTSVSCENPTPRRYLERQHSQDIFEDDCTLQVDCIPPEIPVYQCDSKSVLENLEPEDASSLQEEVGVENENSDVMFAKEKGSNQDEDESDWDSTVCSGQPTPRANVLSSTQKAEGYIGSEDGYAEIQVIRDGSSEKVPKKDGILNIESGQPLQEIDVGEKPKSFSINLIADDRSFIPGNKSYNSNVDDSVNRERLSPQTESLGSIDLPLQEKSDMKNLKALFQRRKSKAKSLQDNKEEAEEKISNENGIETSSIHQNSAESRKMQQTNGKSVLTVQSEGVAEVEHGFFPTDFKEDIMTEIEAKMPDNEFLLVNVKEDDATENQAILLKEFKLRDFMQNDSAKSEVKVCDKKFILTYKKEEADLATSKMDERQKKYLYDTENILCNKEMEAAVSYDEMKTENKADVLNDKTVQLSTSVVWKVQGEKYEVSPPPLPRPLLPPPEQCDVACSVAPFQIGIAADDESPFFENVCRPSQENVPAPGLSSYQIFNYANVYQDEDLLSFTSTENENSIVSQLPYGKDVLMNLNLNDATTVFKLQEHLRESRQKFEKERNKCIHIQEKFKLLNEKNVKSQKKNEALTLKKCSLEKMKVHLESKIVNLEHSLIEETALKRDSETIQEQLRKQLERLEQHYRSEKESKQQLELAFYQLQMDKEMQENRAERLENETKGLREQFAELESYVQSKQFNQPQDTEAFFEVETKSDKRSTQDDSLTKSKLLHLQEENQILKTELARLQNHDDDMSFLEESKNFLKKIEELKIEKKQTEETLERKCDHYEDELNSLKTDTLQLTVEMQKLKFEKEKLEEELKVFKNKLENKESEAIMELQSKNELEKVYFQDKENIQKQLSSLEEKLIKERLNTTDSLHNLSIAEQKFASIEKELQKSNIQLSEKKNHLQELQNNLEKQKAIHEAEVKDLQKAKTELEDTQCKLERINSSLESDLRHEREKINMFQKSQEDSQKNHLEKIVQQLHIEKARLEAELTHEKQKSDLFLKDFQESQKKRIELEFLCSNLKNASVLLEEKLGAEQATHALLAQEAEDSKNLWEKEIFSKSKLGLRLVQLEREKQTLKSQIEEEKVKTQQETQVPEQNKVFEAKLAAEMERNRHLTKEVANLGFYLKSAKKRLKMVNGDYDQLKQNLEDQYRMELNKKLEEVNGFLEDQAKAKEKLEHVQLQNESRIKTEKQNVEDELSELRLHYERAVAQREMQETEAKHFRDLYYQEMKSLSFLKSQQQLSVDSTLYNSMRRNKMGLTDFNYTTVSNTQPQHLSSGSPDKSEHIYEELKKELEQSIARHLEAGPHDDIKPVVPSSDHSFLSQAQAGCRSTANGSLLNKSFLPTNNMTGAFVKADRNYQAALSRKFFL